MAQEIVAGDELQLQDPRWLIESEQGPNKPADTVLIEEMTDAQVAEAWAIVDAMGESARRMEDSVGRLQSHIEGMGRKIDEISRLLKTARVESLHA
ncbi:MAG: hypothetical protein M3Y56_14510 [Armatimonadota bacterium]|nr:hypothetical protein [Armatimonadota bacterium]